MLEAISWCTGDTSDSSGNVLVMHGKVCWRQSVGVRGTPAIAPVMRGNV